MITGKIKNLEAIIELEIFGSAQQPQQIMVVIDTGYNGYLTLPNNVITALQLPFAGNRQATLADGSVIVLDVYLAAMTWHGQQRDVLVSQAEGEPLVGMSLLQGSRMTMSVIDDGDVFIEELPQQT